VALQVPPAAEAGIRTAMEGSERVTDAVADVAGRPAVPAELVGRLQSLKALGILTEEEVAKLISAGSRQEAREMLREYAENNIIPGADYRKMDETARYYFPVGFNTIIEIKKFSELKRLETEKPDEATLKKVQEFAQEYQPGEIVPADIRRWFIPLVRLEELQNTIRPDLIDSSWFKYRPEDMQKYEEVVARIRPRPEDIAYVNRLMEGNPNLAADPAYMRLKALGDKFGGACPAPLTWVFNSTLPGGGWCGLGAADEPPAVTRNVNCGQALTSAQSPDGNACATYSTTCIPDGWVVVSGCGVEKRSTADSSYQACGRGMHWVTIPYMPGGGYCVPNYSYGVDGSGGSERACPPSHHRNEPGGSCYPDNQTGGGLVNVLPAAGSCWAGYHWVPEPSAPTRGYCAPDYPGTGGGWPSPITPPSYCPDGMMFREGKCETYNPPPVEGCGENSWWNGQKCIEKVDCSPGQYQDSNGACKSSADEYNRYTSQCAGRPIPAGGCGAGWWDMASCSCVGGSGGGGGGDTAAMQAACERGGCSWNGVGNSCVCPSGGSGSSGMPSRESQEATCRAGGGVCVSWVNDACGCERNTGGTTNSTYTPPATSPMTSGCGQGYYWNGSSCVPSSGSSGSGGSEPSSYTPPPTSTTTETYVPPPTSSEPPPPVPPPAEQPPPPAP
ncbi:MAG: Uncharacterized protein G01um101416_895, partial [Microgenomates group bacterium Gr01-1014_16]